MNLRLVGFTQTVNIKQQSDSFCQKLIINFCRRREELFTNATSSDDDRRGVVRRPKHDPTTTPVTATAFGMKKRPLTSITSPTAPTSTTTPTPTNATNKKILDRKAELKNPALNRKTKLTKKFLEKSSKLNLSSLSTASSVEPATNGKDIKVKKTYRKRKGSEKAPEHQRRLSGSGKKVSRRKSNATVNSDSDADSNDAGIDDDDVDDVDRSQQHLRSWIDQYEEAVTNHYSQELRARLSGNKFAGLGNELKSSVIGGPTRCNVSLKGNGVKVNIFFYCSVVPSSNPSFKFSVD